MIRNLKRTFIATRPGNILYSLFFVAAGIAILWAIGSSLAIAQRSGGSTSLEDDSRRRIDVSAAVPSSSPPQCGPCLQPMETSENFDGVTPPALPLGWGATNVQGPPPLWVTSNSGVPNPAADTLPN